MKQLFILCAMLLATGCTSMSTVAPANHTQYGEVTFYRTAELQGSVSDTYLGWNGQYYYSLASGKNMTVQVPAGFVELNVRAKVDLANELSMEIKPGQHYCVRVEVNPENIILVNWFVPGYQLSAIPCPSAQSS